MITELGKSNISHFMKKILKKSILSETFLCFIAYQTLQGLNYLHMYKIAHLDIKPQNLVITETLEIKIMIEEIKHSIEGLVDNVEDIL